MSANVTATAADADVDAAAAALAYAALNDPAQPPPAFAPAAHAAYVEKVATDTGSPEYALTEYMRLSGVYWGLTTLRLLGQKDALDGPALVTLALSCQNEDGGFGGAPGHDSHMLYTLSALQVLALLGALDRCDRRRAEAYVCSLQQPDGSFFGDRWGEVDTRFSYCALYALAILGRLRAADVKNAAAFVHTCKNFDGGYGCAPGAESHAGQVFCCVGALAIAKRLDLVDRPLLCWWLAERQCDSGGLNGRPEKQADVCYSWWILSVLVMLGADHWVDGSRLKRFILKCQDLPGGGISDRPGNEPDVFHTFFGVGGLSLLGALPDDRPRIDAVFALPEDVVESLGLEAQTVPANQASLLDAWAAERRGAPGPVVK